MNIWRFLNHSIPAGEMNSETRKLNHKLSQYELEIIISEDNSEIIIRNFNQPHHILFRARLDAIQYVREYLLLETPQGRFTFILSEKEEENNVGSSEDQ